MSCSAPWTANRAKECLAEGVPSGAVFPLPRSLSSLARGRGFAQFQVGTGRV